MSRYKIVTFTAVLLALLGAYLQPWARLSKDCHGIKGPGRVLCLGAVGSLHQQVPPRPDLGTGPEERLQDLDIPPEPRGRPDLLKAFHYYDLGCNGAPGTPPEKGDAYGCFDAALLLERPDPERAILYHDRACKLGEPDGCERARLLRTGKPLPTFPPLQHKDGQP